IDICREWFALRVHLEDSASALHIGSIDADLSVEAARAKQRRIEHIWAVRCRDHDDVAVRVKRVHFDEQLVEGLLALVVAAAHALPSPLADRVDLVYKDDRWGVRFGLFEEVAHTTGADAHKHFDEV